MEISFCSHPNTNKVIATIFGTWHDSWAVVACAKFCCDVIISNWIRAKWNFHHIWIVMEKSLVKWVPDTCLKKHKYILYVSYNTWWRHQMETFSALLALYVGNSPLTGEFPAQVSDMELWCFLWSAPESTFAQIMESPVIWNASLWHHCNAFNTTRVNPNHC